MYSLLSDNFYLFSEGGEYSYLIILSSIVYAKDTVRLTTYTGQTKKKTYINTSKKKIKYFYRKITDAT